MRYLPRFVTVLSLILAPLAASGMDVGRDVFLRWRPGPEGEGFELSRLELFREAHITAVLLPWPGPPATERFVSVCRENGIRAIAELQETGTLELARQAAASARGSGFVGLALEAEGVFEDEGAVQKFVTKQDLPVLVYLGPEQIHWDVKPGIAVLREGLWPGVRAPPNQRGRGMEVATASTEPWVDANSYLVAYLRGLFPDRPALLGYRPDSEAGISDGRAVPYWSLELGLIEAFVVGGNFILSLEQDYRDALLKGEPAAKEAWASLGQTVRFLRKHAEALRQANRSRIAIAAGTLAESGEILNLMYRRVLFPVVFPAEQVTELDNSRFRALVAANIAAPRSPSRSVIINYVRDGGLLVTAPAAGDSVSWWAFEGGTKVRSDKDRDHYSFGEGRVVAYHDPIFNPSEFALDVIDLVGVKTRDLRLWNAGSVVGIAAGELEGAKVYIYLMNYGDPIDQQFPARIEGIFQQATLFAPGEQPRELSASKRGLGTEVAVDRLGRFAFIEVEKGTGDGRPPAIPGIPPVKEQTRTY